ncbi:hypothetical protein H072_200 [Dactylellina haptotyla CBS 200.50]|uniref:Uncharacterized protein n=1 Tax=Dactylellina haptotyla (strain CBS 200.50) TaxID=1284197 RepID=S8AY43_DACHA|nr:hypothetical protein H072_200 [Dactylellina haptotyla CBS 200.50]
MKILIATGLSLSFLINLASPMRIADTTNPTVLSLGGNKVSDLSINTENGETLDVTHHLRKRADGSANDEGSENGESEGQEFQSYSPRPAMFWDSNDEESNSPLRHSGNGRPNPITQETRGAAQLSAPNPLWEWSSDRYLADDPEEPDPGQGADESNELNQSSDPDWQDIEPGPGKRIKTTTPKVTSSDENYKPPPLNKLSIPSNLLSKPSIDITRLPIQPKFVIPDTSKPPVAPVPKNVANIAEGVSPFPLMFPDPFSQPLGSRNPLAPNAGTGNTQTDPVSSLRNLQPPTIVQPGAEYRSKKKPAASPKQGPKKKDKSPEPILVNDRAIAALAKSRRIKQTPLPSLAASVEQVQQKCRRLGRQNSEFADYEELVQRAPPFAIAIGERAKRYIEFIDLWQYVDFRAPTEVPLRLRRDGTFTDPDANYYKAFQDEYRVYKKQRKITRDQNGAFHTELVDRAEWLPKADDFGCEYEQYRGDVMCMLKATTRYVRQEYGEDKSRWMLIGNTFQDDNGVDIPNPYDGLDEVGYKAIDKLVHDRRAQHTLHWLYRACAVPRPRRDDKGLIGDTDLVDLYIDIRVDLASASISDAWKGHGMIPNPHVQVKVYYPYGASWADDQTPSGRYWRRWQSVEVGGAVPMPGNCLMEMLLSPDLPCADIIWGGPEGYREKIKDELRPWNTRTPQGENYIPPLDEMEIISRWRRASGSPEGEWDDAAKARGSQTVPSRRAAY